MSPVRIAAVLTAHNRRVATTACLRSLRRQRGVDDVDLDVFLTDDGSTDGTAEAAREAYPGLTVLQGDGALYWNRGMHLAWSAALAGGYDHTLWVNDDVVLDDDALAVLLRAHAELAERRLERSIVVGSTRDPVTGRTTYGGVERPRRARKLAFERIAPSATLRPCETMNGQFVLFPKQVTDRVGNIDPRYTHAMGDYDYGLRARQRDCGVWMAPGTIGTCATNPVAEPGSRPLAAEWRSVVGVKGLPPADWALFARRWAGPAWPLYWASPYLRRGSLLLRARLRRSTAASAAG
jgi:GT2 family glycosyltransferase